MKTFITFGQDHIHKVNGKIFDCNCVAMIESKDSTSGRKMAFELFGRKFSMEYPENKFDFDTMIYFPRGIIEVN